MTINSITVGVDGSDLSNEALRWAVDLAASVGATVRAASTWEMPLITKVPITSDSLPTPEWMENQCREMLAGSIAAAPQSVEIEPIVVEGPPGRTVVAEAKSSDLLVLGRTGRGRRHGFARLEEIVLGSTARYSVHHAHGPVVTVPHSSRWHDPEHALVGLDGSQSSLEALRWTVENLPASTRITAIRAWLPWRAPWTLANGVPDEAAVLEIVRDETQTWIDDALSETPTDRDRLVEIKVVVGRAGNALCDATESGEGPDRVGLVVVGERGRTGVAERVLGSTTDHVVRNAACPVVVIPEGVR